MYSSRPPPARRLPTAVCVSLSIFCAYFKDLRLLFPFFLLNFAFVREAPFFSARIHVYTCTSVGARASVRVSVRYEHVCGCAKLYVDTLSLVWLSMSSFLSAFLP